MVGDLVFIGLIALSAFETRGRLRDGVFWRLRNGTSWSRRRNGRVISKSGL